MNLSLLLSRRDYAFSILRHLTVKKAVNLLSCVAGYAFRMRRSGSVPPVLTVMLTYRCNYRCIMCQKASVDDNEYHHPTTMEFDQLKSFIESYGDRILVLRLFGGEPLMHPRIGEVLDLLDERGITYVIGTNGSLLGPEVVERVVGRCGWISISFDSADDERYAWIRQGGELETLRRNLDLIAETKRARGTRYPIMNGNATVFTYNLDDVEGLIHFCREHGVESLSLSAGKLYNTPEVREEHLLRNHKERARDVLDRAKALAASLDFNLRVRMRSIYLTPRSDELRSKDEARRKPGLYFEMTIQPDFRAVAAFEGYRDMGSLDDGLGPVWDSTNGEYAMLRHTP